MSFVPRHVTRSPPIGVRMCVGGGGGEGYNNDPYYFMIII